MRDPSGLIYRTGTFVRTYGWLSLAMPCGCLVQFNSHGDVYGVILCKFHTGEFERRLPEIQGPAEAPDD